MVFESASSRGCGACGEVTCDEGGADEQHARLRRAADLKPSKNALRAAWRSELPRGRVGVRREGGTDGVARAWTREREVTEERVDAGA